MNQEDVDIECKKSSEVGFWRGWLGDHGLGARTLYYRQFMMNMGGVEDQSFFDGLICVDIGCGPMGSMTWLTNAKVAIGLDPLVQSYMEFEIVDHDMLYLQAGAEKMPFPDSYVDVIFSMNSLDHVDDLDATCKEVRRVLKPGGYFIGSLNLHEPATPTEPWTLTEELLADYLFRDLEKEFYAVQPKVEDGDDPYRYFFQECPKEVAEAGHPQALWCRFRVPLDQTT